MNPVKQIGRYQLPILSVIGIKKRVGLKYWVQSLAIFIGLLIVALVRRHQRPAWPDPGYDAMLATGLVIHFTAEEKRLLDEAVDEHDLVMQIYGMCRSAGLKE
jgi:hypothetical protein